MKLKQFIEEMPSWEDSDRAKINALIDLLCPISVQTLREFQQKWNNKRPYGEFVKSQNEEILKCVGLEKSSLGIITRAAMGLPPITDDTEVPIP